MKFLLFLKGYSKISKRVFDYTAHNKKSKVYLKVQSSNFERELQFLNPISHKNIISPSKVFTLKKNVIMELPYLHHNFTWCYKNNKNKQKSLLNLTKAVYYLIDKNIIHCDLRPRNIMSNGQEAIIIDFDFASAPNSSTNLKGSIFFPPEFLQNKVSLYSDLYSLGVVMSCILLNGKLPEKFENGKSKILIESLKENIGNKPIIKLIQQFTHEDPKQRYLSLEIAISLIENSFFAP